MIITFASVILLVPSSFWKSSTVKWEISISWESDSLALNLALSHNSCGLSRISEIQFLHLWNQVMPWLPACIKEKLVDYNKIPDLEALWYTYKNILLYRFTKVIPNQSVSINKYHNIAALKSTWKLSHLKYPSLTIMDLWVWLEKLILPEPSWWFWSLCAFSVAQTEGTELI